MSLKCVHCLSLIITESVKVTGNCMEGRNSQAKAIKESLPDFNVHACSQTLILLRQSKGIILYTFTK